MKVVVAFTAGGCTILETRLAEAKKMIEDLQAILAGEKPPTVMVGSDGTWLIVTPHVGGVSIIRKDPEEAWKG